MRTLSPSIIDSEFIQNEKLNHTDEDGTPKLKLSPTKPKGEPYRQSISRGQYILRKTDSNQASPTRTDLDESQIGMM